MADQTDEEKVQAALAKEVEEPQAPADPEAAEPTEAEPTDTPEEGENQTPGSEEEPSTFTKPQGFEWVKGETPEAFIENLIEAYKNSSGEALKLRDQLKNAQTPAPPADTTGQTPDLNSLPEIQMLRAEQQTKMISAFDEFAEKYPQAREPDSFEKFQKASDGVAQAFVAANGRLATYPELFQGVAQVLGWQASNAQRDAAIKAAGSGSGSAGGTTAAPAKPSPFNAETLRITRRIPGNEKKSDSELIKELSEAMAS